MNRDDPRKKKDEKEPFRANANSAPSSPAGDGATAGNRERPTQPNLRAIPLKRTSDRGNSRLPEQRPAAPQPARPELSDRDQPLPSLPRYYGDRPGTGSRPATSRTTSASRKPPPSGSWKRSEPVVYTSDDRSFVGQTIKYFFGVLLVLLFSAFIYGIFTDTRAPGSVNRYLQGWGLSDLPLVRSLFPPRGGYQPPDYYPTPVPVWPTPTPVFDFPQEFAALKQQMLGRNDVLAVAYPRNIVEIAQELSDSRWESGAPLSAEEKTALLDSRLAAVPRAAMQDTMRHDKEAYGFMAKPTPVAKKSAAADEVIRAYLEPLIPGLAAPLSVAPSESEVKIRRDSERSHLSDLEIIGRHGSLPMYDRWVALSLISERYQGSIRQKIHVEVSEEEALAYYQQHQNQFVIPETIRLSQIFIAVSACDSQQERGQKQNRAEEIRDKAATGTSFGDLAQQHTEDGNNRLRGSLGIVRRGDIPDFEEAIFALRTGDISPVLTSQSGFHIFWAEEYQPPGIKPFTEVRDTIRSQLLGQREAAALSTSINQIRDSVVIERAATETRHS